MAASSARRGGGRGRAAPAAQSEQVTRSRYRARNVPRAAAEPTVTPGAPSARGRRPTKRKFPCSPSLQRPPRTRAGVSGPSSEEDDSEDEKDNDGDDDDD